LKPQIKDNPILQKHQKEKKNKLKNDLKKKKISYFRKIKPNPSQTYEKGEKQMLPRKSDKILPHYLTKQH